MRGAWCTLFLCAILGTASAGAAGVVVQSPDGQVQGVFSVDRDRLTYMVQRAGKTIIEASPLGITIDGMDLGLDVALGAPAMSTIDERYPWRGMKSEVRNNCTVMQLPVTQTGSGKAWTLEVRAFNDALAYRYLVPGTGKRLIQEETSGWQLPEGSFIWYRLNDPENNGFERKDEKALPADIEKGLIFQFPATVELPDGTYASLLESGTFLWTGLSLVATGTNLIAPLYREHRNGFSWEGDVQTPWRITMTGPTLNDLVNCDVVPNLCPPPDPALFPKGIQTEWIKTGRSLWQWWAFDDAGTVWDNQKQFVDWAKELNCQFYLVDAGWENPKYGWVGEDGTSWAKMKALCDYAATKGIDILVWRSWEDCSQGPGIETPEKRKAFMDGCVAAGVKGVKIDYLSSESLDRYRFTVDVLRDAAEHKLTVDFHGCPKPTGEERTWPNEVSREGVKGLEHNKWSTLDPQHYACVPFMRMLAGHADFTPTTFQPRMLKGTTVCLQLAMSIVATSPILCWADKPEIYLESPAVDLIKTMPWTWEETIVLPGSKIGDLAAYARRSGNDWYVGMINGDAAKGKTYTLDLSFLGEGKYKATYCRDVPEQPAEMKVKKNVRIKKDKKEVITLSPGGGFVGVFKKK